MALRCEQESDMNWASQLESLSCEHGRLGMGSHAGQQPFELACAAGHQLAAVWPLVTLALAVAKLAGRLHCRLGLGWPHQEAVNVVVLMPAVNVPALRQHGIVVGVVGAAMRRGDDVADVLVSVDQPVALQHSPVVLSGLHEGRQMQGL